MSTTEIAVIVAMVGYAVYKQTQVSEATGRGRFKLAIIYAVVGVAVGGFAMPHTVLAVALLALGLALSAVVGLARGRLTRMWVENGRVMRQGTALTVGLFLALVLAKFGIGTYEYLAGVRDTGGFGEVMVMIGVMVAVQAEIVWRRAQAVARAAGIVTAPEREAVAA
jgi:hypothetical protein